MTSPALPRDANTETPAASVDVAAHLRPVVQALLGADVPIRFEFWDGTVIDHRSEEHTSDSSH